MEDEYSALMQNKTLHLVPLQPKPYPKQAPRGSTKAQGSKAKSTSWVSTAQSKQSERQSDTKDNQQLALLGTPSRGPNILKLCI
jgi:hypothetical protein